MHHEQGATSALQQRAGTHLIAAAACTGGFPALKTQLCVVAVCPCAANKMGLSLSHGQRTHCNPH